MRNTQRFTSLHKPNRLSYLQQSTAHKRHSPPPRPSLHSTVHLFQSTQPLHPRRKKIFTPTTTIKCQHIEIGVSKDNLSFQDLDQSLLPICFTSFECGCENSTIPCEKITNSVPGEALRRMRGKFESLKEITVKSRVDYASRLMRFTGNLPKQFPEALIPSIETVIKLEDELDEELFCLLTCIFFHAKIDYIAYWIYKQLTQSFYNQSFYLQNSLRECIDTHSKTVSRLLTRNRLTIGDLVKNFCRSYGTSQIPMKMYGLFIQMFNKKGKEYLSRVLFVLVLFLYPKLGGGGDVEEVRMEWGEKIPWERILRAAADKKLY